KWVKFYNQQRPHSSLGGQTPYAVYWNRNKTEQPGWQTRIVA
ncbi:MAG: integrase core domain-containing protein, partial [Fimbriimonadaceae bacterium]|nr:integrase core domain-containing protein [Alphaproteobacteria bacterium]